MVTNKRVFQNNYEQVRFQVLTMVSRWQFLGDAYSITSQKT